MGPTNSSCNSPRKLTVSYFPGRSTRLPRIPADTRNGASSVQIDTSNNGARNSSASFNRETCPATERPFRFGRCLRFGWGVASCSAALMDAVSTSCTAGTDCASSFTSAFSVCAAVSSRFGLPSVLSFTASTAFSVFAASVFSAFIVFSAFVVFSSFIVFKFLLFTSFSITFSDFMYFLAPNDSYLWKR